MPTYTPTNPLLDHWLMRIPNEASKPLPTITTTLNTEYSDHKAPLAEIAQAGDPIDHTPTLDKYSTTRHHPPSSS